MIARAIARARAAYWRGVYRREWAREHRARDADRRTMRETRR